MKSCIVCEKPSSLKCAGCVSVNYCSRECQKSDWKRHKLDCCDNARLAKEIVDDVRRTVKSDSDGDPWDERTDGVAWLDNEVGMAISFFNKLDPSNTVSLNLEDCYTVFDFQRKLASLSYSSLHFIHRFIVVFGGSTESYFFDLRNEPVDIIRQWFDERKHL